VAGFPIIKELYGKTFQLEYGV